MTSHSLPVGHAKPAALPRSVARTAIGLAVLVFAAGFVVFVRIFAFEYFHGDPAALHGLMHTVFGT